MQLRGVETLFLAGMQWFPTHGYVVMLSVYVLLNKIIDILHLDYVHNLFLTLLLGRCLQSMNSVLLLPGQGWVQVSSRTICLLPSTMSSMSVQSSSSTTLLKSSAEPSLTTQEIFRVLVPSPHWASWNGGRNS